MASSTSEVPDIYAYRDRQLLSRYNEQHKDIPPYDLSKIKEVLRNPEPSPTSPVCIIGAGMAGLYTAMIFESLEISYQIVDADTRARVGGRLFTYYFPNGNPYDYYVCWVSASFTLCFDFCIQDVGAMRFPDTPFMKRVFDLVRNRNLPVKLIPYVMQMVEPSPNTFLFYNNARVNNQDHSVVGDPFDVLSYVRDESLTTPQGVARKISAVLQPFRDLFRNRAGEQPPDIATAIDQLYSLTNRLSMRTYMSTVLQMDDRVINWCETLDKSTGWYDRALAESA